MMMLCSNTSHVVLVRVSVITCPTLGHKSESCTCTVGTSTCTRCTTRTRTRTRTCIVNPDLYDVYQQDVHV
eukprot:jgi/Psemu1/306006/fgenesh1_kg.230_\